MTRLRLASSDFGQPRFGRSVGLSSAGLAKAPSIGRRAFWLGEFRLLAPALALAALLLGPGCALGVQRFGQVIDARQIGQIKIGKSTKQDVLDLFGPPTSFNRVGAFMGFGVSGPDGEGGGKPWGWPADDVFTYEYREENETFMTFLLFTWFGRDVIYDRLMVFFDPGDVVKYVAFGKQTDAEFEATESGD